MNINFFDLVPTLLYVVVASLINRFIGVYVTKQKNRPSLESFLFGFLGSILGLIIVALLPNKKQKSITTEKIKPTCEAIRIA